MISEKFKVRLKLADEPAYRIAQKADVDPNTLSKLIHGIEKPRPNDPRIISVGRLLGLDPWECFE